MILNLCEGLAQSGIATDLLIARAKSAHLEEIPDRVRLVDLRTGHTLSSLPALVGYLKQERPAALLAAKDRAIKVAVLARALSGVPVRLVGRLGTTVSAALEGQGRLRRAAWYAGMRLFYPRVDRIVAVSEGVAEDVRRITGLTRERVGVVRNPVWTPRLERLAREAPPHPWLEQASVPVILGAGRLTRQKDFLTLVRAFAQVRAVRECRLLVLGEGRQREALLALAKTLGVERDVALPGFQRNPYAWLARASLFVLSSAWEGSPNVLTEALALGVPVVATDCPSGPREILAGVDTVDSCRSATCERWHVPCSRRSSGRCRGDPAGSSPPYTLEASTRGYLEALGLVPGDDGASLRPQ